MKKSKNTQKSKDIKEEAQTPPVGEMLCIERVRLNISTKEIAQHLKVKDRDIIAIEKGDLSKISSGLYLSGVISQYAAIVGIDKNIINKKYLELKSNSKSEKKPKARLKVEGDLNHSPEREVFAVSFVLSLIVVFILLFYYNRTIKTNHTQARDFIKNHEIR